MADEFSRKADGANAASDAPQESLGAAATTHSADDDELLASRIAVERDRMRRYSVSSLIDSAGASHLGGMGAQGGQADFGNPTNFARH